jgi:hypothetical protein
MPGKTGCEWMEGRGWLDCRAAAAVWETPVLPTYGARPVQNISGLSYSIHKIYYIETVPIISYKF